MIIKPQDFRFCLDQAKYMAEQHKTYAHPGDTTPKDINEFVRICKEQLNFNITLKSIPIAAANSGIRGFFIRTTDAYEIYILEGLNTCWEAFVRCKELFHILLDNPEYRNMDIYAHLEEVTIAFPLPASSPGKSVTCECMAEIAAMEFLYPYSMRKHDHQKKPIDYLAIAKHYRIPRVYVEAYLRDDVMKTLGSFF